MKLNQIELEENHTRVSLSKLPEKKKCSNTSDVYIGISIRSGEKAIFVHWIFLCWTWADDSSLYFPHMQRESIIISVVPIAYSEIPILLLDLWFNGPDLALSPSVLT